MAGKAAQRFSRKVPKKTEAAVRAQMEHPIRPENHQAEPSDTGLDKLLQRRVNEISVKLGLTRT